MGKSCPVLSSQRLDLCICEPWSARDGCQQQRLQEAREKSLEAPEVAHPTDTLVSDFQLPEYEKMIICCLSHLVVFCNGSPGKLIYFMTVFFGTIMYSEGEEKGKQFFKRLLPMRHYISKKLLWETHYHVGWKGETNSDGYKPIQFLGPAEKGTYAYGWRPCKFSGKNRSGWNSSGSGKYLGSLCSA